jgi:predicted nucleotidyltransferase
MPNLSNGALDKLAEAARGEEDLDLLLLFGSRARGDSHPGSDWDLGFLARPGFDVDEFLGRAVRLLGSDHVDLVDLAHASGLLRFRAAGEGRVLFQSEPGCFDRFWFEAVSFWCDAQPILDAGYRAILERLPS